MLEEKLLILDIDETLIHATKAPPDDDWAFICGPFFVYLRPGLKEFLHTALIHYKVALWTTGSSSYAKCIAEKIFTDINDLLFIWSREKCIIRQESESGRLAYLKDLKKTKCFNIPLERVLIVEDTPKAVSRNMGNLIKVNKFFGQKVDDDLVILGNYLILIKDVANFRELEKRDWRSIASRTEGKNDAG